MSARRPGRAPAILLASALLAGSAYVTATTDATAAEARILFGLDRPGGVERALERVSDPDSPDYRDHLSLPALRGRFGARPASVRRVQAVLARSGVDSAVDPTRTFVAATMSEEQAARVLGPGADRLVDAKGIVRNAPDALPRSLRGAVTEVAGLDALAESDDASEDDPRGQQHAGPGLQLPPRTGRAEGCDEGRNVTLGGDLGARFPGTRGFTPNQFRTAFGFDALHRAGTQGQGQSIALLEFGGGFRRHDVTTFARCFGMPEPNVRVHTVGIPAPVVPIDGEATLETTLDIQTVMTAAPRARIEVMEAGQTPFAEGLAAALDARRLGRLPRVISVSYGTCEPLEEVAGQGPAGRRLFDRVAATAGLAGVSVLVAAGDSGSSACAHGLGPIPLPDVAATVIGGSATVAYPATSPVVTAVGGTSMRLDARNRIVSQRPWNDTDYGLPAFETAEIEGIPIALFTAGAGTGGASRLYRQPAYQADAGLASSRRQVPDVAMYADEAPGIALYCSAWDAAAQVGPCPPSPENGHWLAIGGTSFAAPLLAGGIALANQRAAAQGAAPLGFANPLLYQPATRRAALRDVTKGGNAIFPVGCCQASSGFDQATGWGTVDVAKLAAAAQRAWTRRARSGAE